jgi:electron transfer flavoprotein beta subunit
MMRIVAVVELGWDPASIEVDPVSGAIDWVRAAREPSPGSREAVELALGLGEVHVYGLGPPDVEDLLRECLALGAAAAAMAPDVEALAAALSVAPFDLVLAPHRSGDGAASPVAGALAGLLDLPQATGVEALAVHGGEVRAVRRLDKGEREEVAAPLPAVIAVEPGIVRPRLASPAALIAARSAPVAELPAVRAVRRPALLGHRPPRPAPPRMAAPAGDLTAEARIAAVVGAAADSRQRELVTGTAAQVAERILRLLEERGYLRASPGPARR